MKEGFSRKPKVKVEQERIRRMEDLGEKIQKAKDQTPETRQEESQSLVSTNLQETKQKLQEREFNLTEEQEKVLELKLTRYFQNENSLDINTFTDAMVESPKWLKNEKGSVGKLFDLHEVKTIEKLAEARKAKAEQTGEGFNPYEALFQTDSGEYYLANLLNMKHLKDESGDMNHCVGTSDSYLNRMKEGEIEILSFRTTPKFNQETQKLEGDHPVITIEYNLKTKKIEQIKKADDELLTKDDPYYQEFMEVLEKMQNTTYKNKQNEEEKREIKSVKSYELENVEVEKNHILTTKGEISLEEIDLNNFDETVLKTNFEITEETTKEDFGKMVMFPGELKIESEEITKEFFDGSIKECNASLDLSKIKNGDGLIFPETMNGYINLRRLQSAEGLVFPETLNGDLWLEYIQSAEGLVLPETINGSLWLNSLQSTEGLVLPETLNGDLYLDGLQTAEGLVLPETLNGGLYLRGLQSAEELVLPETMNGDLWLINIQLAEGLVLPENIDGKIYLLSISEQEQEELKEKYPQYIEQFDFG